MTKVVQGEAVQLEKFNDYWQGKPSLDKINLKVIDQTQIVKAMKNGEIDMTDSTTGSIAQEAKNLEMVNLKYYQHQAQTILLLVLYLMIMIKRRIKLVQNVLNIKKKNLDKQCYMQLIEKWIKAFYQGYGKELNSFVPSIHWIAADQKT